MRKVFRSCTRRQLMECFSASLTRFSYQTTHLCRCWSFATCGAQPCAFNQNDARNKTLPARQGDWPIYQLRHTLHPGSSRMILRRLSGRMTCGCPWPEVFSTRVVNFCTSCITARAEAVTKPESGTRMTEVPEKSQCPISYRGETKHEQWFHSAMLRATDDSNAIGTT